MQSDILRIYLEFVSRMVGNIIRVAYDKSQYNIRTKNKHLLVLL